MSTAQRNALSRVAIAWPTLALACAALAIWCGSAIAGATGAIPLALAVAINVVAAFLSFTPMHDACHRSLARNRAINEVVGRLCAVPLTAPFLAFRHVHLEHHKHTNDRDADPDHWSGRGPRWSLPLRWATQDLYYYYRYARVLSQRPRAERLEVVATAAAMVAALVALALAGHGLEAVLLWLVPPRIAVVYLAFAFDFLPHHPYDTPAAVDRHRATRVFPNPALILPTMYQNYHLVHHLYPAVPFYRMGRIWRERREELVQRGARVSALEDVLAPRAGREQQPDGGR